MRETGEKRNGRLTDVPCTVPADVTAVTSCHFESSEDSLSVLAAVRLFNSQPDKTKKRVNLADYKRKHKGGGREGRSSIPLPGTLSTLPLPNPPLSLPSLLDLPGVGGTKGA